MNKLVTYWKEERWTFNVASFLDSYPSLVYITLGLFYILWHLSNLLILNSFTSAVFPLDSIYYGSKLLFSGMSINPELASTVLTVSNSTLDYPPGLFTLSNILGSVHNIFIFLAVIQLLVPFLIYHLIKKVSSNIIAFLIAILSVVYFTNINWWLSLSRI